MQPTRDRTTRTHKHHCWPRWGPDPDCSTCYLEALDYTAERIGRFGVSGLWADDVAEVALERTVEAFDPNYPSRSSAPFRSFLVAVARNLARNHIRAELRRKRRSERWQTGQARISAAEQFDDWLADTDLVGYVVAEARQTWDDRNPTIARVFEMWLLGVEQAAIASELGIHERTVRRHRRLIDDWLRRRFGS